MAISLCDTDWSMLSGNTSSERQESRANSKVLRIQDVTCQVPGCINSIPLDRLYFLRSRICPQHHKADTLIVKGITVRFCQQCACLQPLTEFDGKRRSCRAGLAAHNARRRVFAKKPDGTDGTAAAAANTRAGSSRASSTPHESAVPVTCQQPGQQHQPCSSEHPQQHTVHLAAVQSAFSVSCVDADGIDAAGCRASTAVLPVADSYNIPWPLEPNNLHRGTQKGAARPLLKRNSSFLADSPSQGFTSTQLSEPMHVMGHAPRSQQCPAFLQQPEALVSPTGLNSSGSATVLQPWPAQDCAAAAAAPDRLLPQECAMPEAAAQVQGGAPAQAAYLQAGQVEVLRPAKRAADLSAASSASMSLEQGLELLDNVLFERQKLYRLQLQQQRQQEWQAAKVGPPAVGVGVGVGVGVSGVAAAVQPATQTLTQSAMAQLPMDTGTPFDAGCMSQCTLPSQTLSLPLRGLGQPGLAQQQLRLPLGTQLQVQQQPPRQQQQRLQQHELLFTAVKKHPVLLGQHDLGRLSSQQEQWQLPQPSSHQLPPPCLPSLHPGKPTAGDSSSAAAGRMMGATSLLMQGAVLPPAATACLPLVAKAAVASSRLIPQIPALAGDVDAMPIDEQLLGDDPFAGMELMFAGDIGSL